MMKKQLGNSDLHLSPIGFGAWAIGGGDWAFAWGPQDDSHSIAAVHNAIIHTVAVPSGRPPLFGRLDQGGSPRAGGRGRESRMTVGPGP